MPAERVLVIDAGTSALRAIAVTAEGTVEVVSAEALPTVRPRGGSEFAREFSHAFEDRAYASLLEQAAVRTPDVAALAFTGQREALACIASNGQPVMLSPNTDARAAGEGAAFDARLGERVYDTTGHLPSLLMAPAKLAWLRAHRPDDAARVHAVLPFADWLAARLTGEPKASRNLTCEIGLIDVGSGASARELSVELVGADAAEALHRAEIVDEAEVAGVVREGPFKDVPVVLAGGDTQCGALGGGAAQDGDCAVVAGWSAPLQLVLDRPLLDAKRRTWTGMHVVPGHWVLESSAGDTGVAWTSICSLLAVDAEQGDSLAREAEAGAEDTLMVLGRAPMNAAGMAAGVGAITFPLPFAAWPLRKRAVARAALEAAAYAVRANLEQLEEVSGRRIDVLRMGGGMSRSALFAQIVADVLDRPVEVARSPETTALGAAALAFVAVGVHRSIDEAVAAMALPTRRVTPDARDSATYDDCYARWREMLLHMERSP